MSPIARPEMFPGSMALIAALDGGCSSVEAGIQAVSTRVRVFGYRKHAALARELWQVEREQYLAEIERNFMSTI